MRPQKPGNSPGSEPGVVERQKIAKEQSTQRVCRWTGKNEMRGVLGRCPEALQDGFSILPILEFLER